MKKLNEDKPHVPFYERLMNQGESYKTSNLMKQKETEVIHEECTFKPNTNKTVSSLKPHQSMMQATNSFQQKSMEFRGPSPTLDSDLTGINQWDS
jgi:hypothetical protein